MVESSKSRSTSLKKLARQSTSSTTSKKASIVTTLNIEAVLLPIEHENLQQGSIYIIKVKQVSLALFEGWNDDMCCFLVLRSEFDPMRWSETRQLPGDFDIYDAFDEYGNPPIHLWSRYLKTSLPGNWFHMFEESRRKQRLWLKEEEEYYSRNGLENNNDADPSLSNTDVSSMLLSPHTSNISSNNVTDQNFSNIEATTPLSEYKSTEDHKDSNTEIKHTISPKSNSTVIDREQIRRHLAPGQATAYNRQTITTQQNTTPLFDFSSLSIGESKTIQQYSAQIEFPHDSDQFSILSDISTKNPSPPAPIKTRKRPSMKKIFWS